MTTPIDIDVKEFINNVILREIKTIVYSKECAKAPYVKFVLIATGIEFLGACGDTFEFPEKQQSESRFNYALDTYFSNSYKGYAREGSEIYLFEDFRCAMIHQLRPTPKINLTERNKGHNHLDKDDNPLKLHLVLEDFYDDLEKAANKFLKMAESGKISNVPKTKSSFIKIDKRGSGSTETIA